MNIFQKAISAGFSCVPCNGKVPTKNWKKYTTIRATMKEASTWSGNIGIVCGKISGGLIALDFDIKNGDRLDEWITDVNNIKPELLSLLYCEKTPSGGMHICYRSKNEMNNKKLACNINGEVMIETRGENGIIVCAPSKGYEVFFGKLSKLKQITDDDESILLAVAEGFNEFEREEYKPKHSTEVTGDTVFNRFDSVTDPVPILQAHGWSVVNNHGNRVYLRRPGKNEGISATWNAVPDRFYCFSTSTKFESEKVYKASAVYAILEHDGDYKAAAKALYDSGYDKKQ